MSYTAVHESVAAVTYNLTASVNSNFTNFYHSDGTTLNWLKTNDHAVSQKFWIIWPRYRVG